MTSAPCCANHPDRTAAAPCSRCHKLVCPDCLTVQLDGEFVCGACSRRFPYLPLPWDELASWRHGAPRAFARSVRRVLAHPLKTLDQARPDASGLQAITFGVLALVLAAALNVALLALFGDRDTMTLIALASIPFGLWWLLVLPLGEWVVLRLAVGARCTLRAQLRASGYSLAPLALAFVPVVGILVLLPCCALLRLIACRQLQRIGWDGALVATVMAPIVLISVFMWLRLDVVIQALFG